MKPTLSIIIPAYNEARTIGEVLDKVLKSTTLNKIETQIIVVDDASKDETLDHVADWHKRNPEAQLVTIASQPNRGKGFAIRKGIEAAEGDYILIQDADHEYDPREYPKLLAPVLDGMANVVYGSRFVGGNPHRILFFWHSI
ncbi:MAG: glycosyltransferase family 2 protein, partial [Bacteroidetes bacterium]|nr:glycosyltransferase family 2 protein [Bacteroidota bacterium]